MEASDKLIRMKRIRETEKLHARPHVRFLEQKVLVIFYGVDAYIQLIGDLFIGEAFTDQLYNIFLSWCECC